ncbi:CsbD family protein [Falsirhodobacter halotolerans]|uniref:CsbD family protein n=1 Tax=Falsirhodobacter halotolerans TaxID=1146892 RepID=UPI001FD59BE1|nr:CsbD family protein [Falsirhodobacter halotolerans]MCJ8141150.1 CsbD family protein [Falsirhodobacter halotolerans]
MGEMVDKAKAAGNKLAGGAKDAIGKATDNPDLQAEGKAQKAKGAAQDVSGTVKGKLGDNV